MRQKFLFSLLLLSVLLTACSKSISFPDFTAAPDEAVPLYYTAHDFAELDFPVYYFLRADGTIAYRAYANGTFYKIALTATDRVALDTKVEPVAVTEEEPYGIPERAANAPSESRWERVVDGLYRIGVEEFYLYRAWGRIGNVTAFFPATEKGEFLPGGTPDVHTIGKRRVRLMAPGSKGVLLKTEAAEVRLATKLVNDEEQKVYHQELEKKHAEQRKLDREREARWANETPTWNRTETPAHQENAGSPSESPGNVREEKPSYNVQEETPSYNVHEEKPSYDYTPRTTIPVVPATSPDGIDHHLGGNE